MIPARKDEKSKKSGCHPDEFSKQFVRFDDKLDIANTLNYESCFYPICFME